jgi:WD40 repeat protein
MKTTMFVTLAAVLFGGGMVCMYCPQEANATLVPLQPPPYRPSYWGVAFLPDGKRLLTASDDGLILWDINKAEKLRVMGTGRYKYSLGVMALSVDGKWVLEIGLRPSIGLWEIATGERVGTLDSEQNLVKALTLSPDNKLALIGGNGPVERDSAPNKPKDNLQLWDLKKGQVVYRLTGHKGPVISVAFSSDGKLGLSASTDDAPNKQSIKLWDLEKGLLIRSHEFQDPANARKGSYSQACFSQDDKWMYSLGLRLRAWDVNSTAPPLILR